MDILVRQFIMGVMKLELFDVATLTTQLGLSRTTIWRMERRGDIVFARIGRRRFLTAAALAEFNRRLLAGEFAKSGSATPSPL